MIAPGQEGIVTNQIHALEVVEALFPSPLAVPQPAAKPKMLSAQSDVWSPAAVTKRSMAVAVPTIAKSATTLRQ